MCAIYSRILRRTPTEPFRCHCNSTIRCHIAATHSRGGGDIADRTGSYLRQTVASSESLLGSINGACAIGGISADMVGGAWIQTGNIGSEGSISCAIFCMATVEVGIAYGVPAYASGSDGKSSVVTDNAAAFSRIGGDVADSRGGDGRQTATCGERLLRRIECTCTVDSIGAHIIGGGRL